jgi:hypothetical protein
MTPMLETIAVFAGLAVFLAVFIGGIILGIQDMRGPPILPGQPAPLPSWLKAVGAIIDGAFDAFGTVIVGLYITFSAFVRGVCRLIFAAAGVMLALWFVALITGSWPFAICAAVFIAIAFVAWKR